MTESPKDIGPKRRFQWRALTSVLISGAFLILLLSGIMLFVAPPGRIANWTNWTLLSLTKKQWTALHISFSALFLDAAVLHVIFNWRPLVGYFKDRVAGRVSFKWEWATALALCVLAWLGTQHQWQPFAALLAFNDQVKERWEPRRVSAPIPHAELLSLAELARQAGLDFAVVSNRLAAAGARDFTAETTLQAVADRTQRSAEQWYAIMAGETSGKGKGRQGKGGGGAGGESGRGGGGTGGVGWKTLSQFCADEGLEVPQALQRLKSKNIQATPDQTLRDIAQQNGLGRPAELLSILRPGGGQ